jgi:hypothetical protein
MRMAMRRAVEQGRGEVDVDASWKVPYDVKKKLLATSSFAVV